MITRLDDFFVNKYLRLAMFWVRKTYTSSDRLLLYVFYAALFCELLRAVATLGIGSVVSAFFVVITYVFRQGLLFDTGTFLRIVCLIPVAFVVLHSITFVVLSLSSGRPAWVSLSLFMGSVTYATMVYGSRVPTIDPPPKPVRKMVSAWSPA